MIDKNLVRKRFAAAGGSYDAEADVQGEIASCLARLISEFVPAECRDSVLEIGCGTGLLTRHIVSDIAPKELYLNDLCPEFEAFFKDLDLKAFIASDAETAVFPSGLGLIASSSAIQWFDDLPGFFRKCLDSLRSGGYMALSTFAPGNLQEMAALTGYSLPYLAMEDLKSILPSDFQVIHSSESKHVKYFQSPGDVLRHLKRTGVNSISSRTWTRSDLSEFSAGYADFKTVDGYPLTYRPLYLLCRRK